MPESKSLRSNGNIFRVIHRWGHQESLSQTASIHVMKFMAERTILEYPQFRKLLSSHHGCHAYSQNLKALCHTKQMTVWAQLLLLISIIINIFEDFAIGRVTVTIFDFLFGSPIG